MKVNVQLPQSAPAPPAPGPGRPPAGFRSGPYAPARSPPRREADHRRELGERVGSENPWSPRTWPRPWPRMDSGWASWTPTSTARTSPSCSGKPEPRAPPGEEGAEQIEPLEAHGVRLMSIGFMLDKDQPAIMRGPLISGILRQFLEQVAWGPLDYMVVDMPPGTGDAQISLVQTIDLDGAVMVTTPQNISTGDVRRGVRMFEKVNTRVLGIVENMSGYECPHCGGVVEIFGKGGGEELAKDMELPFLGACPWIRRFARQETPVYPQWCGPRFSGRNGPGGGSPCDQFGTPGGGLIGMRLTLLPAPGPGEVETLGVHELVRDYPELLPALARDGMSLQSMGAGCLGAGSGGASRAARSSWPWSPGGSRGRRNTETCLASPSSRISVPRMDTWGPSRGFWQPKPPWFG